MQSYVRRREREEENKEKTDRQTDTLIDTLTEKLAVIQTALISQIQKTKVTKAVFEPNMS